MREPDKEALDFFLTEIISGRLKKLDLPSILENSEEYRKLYDLKNGFTITNEGFSMILDPEDKIISRTIAVSGWWEPSETKFLKKIVKEGMTAVDIGANIGYFTILLSKLVGPNGRVISFEPNPNSFSILKRNIMENKLDNVLPVQKAVTNYEGKTKLYVSTDNHGDNRIFGFQIEETDENRHEIIVDTTFLDRELLNEKIDVMKIDAQGSELHIMEGGTETIQKNRALKIILEFWPVALTVQGKRPRDLLTKIHKLGFNIYDLSGSESPAQIDELCTRYTGKSYTNLYCVRT